MRAASERLRLVAVALLAANAAVLAATSTRDVRGMEALLAWVQSQDIPLPNGWGSGIDPCGTANCYTQSLCAAPGGNVDATCTWSGLCCRAGNVVQLNMAAWSRKKLSGPIAASALTQLRALEYFNISGHRLSSGLGDVVWSSLPNLYTLDLSKNAFDGGLIPDLALTVGFLYLQENSFSGSVPSLSARSLRLANFSNNQLSSSLPSSLANLDQLQTLDLSNNCGLCGTIPPFGNVALYRAGTGLGTSCINYQCGSKDWTPLIIAFAIAAGAGVFFGIVYCLRYRLAAMHPGFNCLIHGMLPPPRPRMVDLQWEAALRAAALAAARRPPKIMMLRLTVFADTGAMCLERVKTQAEVMNDAAFSSLQGTSPEPEPYMVANTSLDGGVATPPRAGDAQPSNGNGTGQPPAAAASQGVTGWRAGLAALTRSRSRRSSHAEIDMATVTHTNTNATATPAGHVTPPTGGGATPGTGPRPRHWYYRWDGGSRRHTGTGNLGGGEHQGSAPRSPTGSATPHTPGAGGALQWCRPTTTQGLGGEGATGCTRDRPLYRFRLPGVDALVLSPDLGVLHFARKEVDARRDEALVAAASAAMAASRAAVSAAAAAHAALSTLASPDGEQGAAAGNGHRRSRAGTAVSMDAPSPATPSGGGALPGGVLAVLPSSRSVSGSTPRLSLQQLRAHPSWHLTHGQGTNDEEQQAQPPHSPAPHATSTPHVVVHDASFTAVRPWEPQPQAATHHDVPAGGDTSAVPSAAMSQGELVHMALAAASTAQEVAARSAAVAAFARRSEWSDPWWERQQALAQAEASMEMQHLQGPARLPQPQQDST